MAIKKLAQPPRTLINLGPDVAMWLQDLYNLLNESQGIEAARIDTSGIDHNDLDGLQGGAAGDYNHLTTQQITDSTSLDALVIDADKEWATYDLFFSGSGSGLPYGSMYNFNVTTSVTIGVIGIYYRIDSGFTTGQTNLTTFQNNRELVVSKAGRYKIDWSISFTTASANQEVEGSVMVNNGVNEQASAHRFIGTATDTGCISGTCILSLSANDVVALGVCNHTGTANISIEHSNLSLVMVGG